MAHVEVCCGAVRQPAGSDSLVAFLLLMGGQDIDEELTRLAQTLATRLLDAWDVEATLPLSMVDPLEAISSVSREMDPLLAQALPLALRQCKALLDSEADVRPLLAYFPGLLDELTDLERLVAGMLGLKGAIRLEIQL